MNQSTLGAICNGPKLETTQMSIHSRMDKYTVVCSHDGLSHSNENDLQSQTTERMNLTNTVLSERSSIQESTYWILHLRRIPENGRSMLLEVRRVFPWRWGGAGGCLEGSVRGTSGFLVMF